MNNVDDVVVKKIVNKLYRDALIINSSEYFIELKYKISQFEDIIDEKSFQTVIGFLPNANYKGVPFVMSVDYDISNKEYTVIVHNQKY